MRKLARLCKRLNRQHLGCFVVLARGRKYSLYMRPYLKDEFFLVGRFSSVNEVEARLLAQYNIDGYYCPNCEG